LAARLRAYLITGILVTAPFAITLYIAWHVARWIDTRVASVVPARWNPETYLPFTLPGLGLLMLLAALMLVGMLAAGYVGRAFTRTIEKIVRRMPVVRSVYRALKQIIETVLAANSSAFREVVAVEFPRRGLWSLGFITGVPSGQPQRLAGEPVVNIFVPTTPNPTSGFLLFAPRSQIVPLAMSVEDGIKLVVSGGMVSPPTVAASPLRMAGG
jgi:uncharacterized membrane protein